MKNILALTVLGSIVLNSCTMEETGMPETDKSRIFLTAVVEENTKTKNTLPVSETIASDLNVFLYDEKDRLADSKYFSDITGEIAMPFFLNRQYSIYVIANAGDLTSDPNTVDVDGINGLIWNLGDLSGLYGKNGAIPMSGRLARREFGNGEKITVSLTRLYAKFRLILDKSSLDSSVEVFEVQKVSLRNLNRNIGFFYNSKSGSESDVIKYGQSMESDDLESLYSTGIDFYIPENAQGNLLPGNIDQKAHIPPEPYNKLCTYVEIFVKYRNKEHYNDSLVYRYYLHDGSMDNFDVLRNTMYTCKTIFLGSGINEETWRIDVSGMKDLVTSIEVSPDNRKFTEIGEKFKYTAAVLPLSAENPKVIWSTDNESVATVEEDGTVTAKGDGSCNVIATATDGTEISGSAALTVDTYKFPESITVSPDECEIFNNETIALDAVILPETADDKNVIWKSTNSDIASVDTDGTVTGIAEGTALIIGCTKANNLMDTAVIHVKKKQFKVEDIPVILYPGYNSPHEIVWSSVPECTPTMEIEVTEGDINGARLDGNMLQAVNNGIKEGTIGSYVLKAVGNGIEIRKEFKADAGSIKIANDVKLIYLGENKSLTISSLTPADANVSWSSSDNTIATVDNNGTIRPLKLGTCKIRATTVTGAYDEAEIEVSYPYIAMDPLCIIHEGTGFDLRDSTDLGSTAGLKTAYRIISGEQYIDLEGSIVKGIMRSGTERAVIEAYYVEIPESHAKTEIIVSPAVTAELISDHRIVNTFQRISDGSDWSIFKNYGQLKFSHAPNTAISWTIEDSDGKIAEGFDIMDNGRINIESENIMGTYTITGWDDSKKYKTDKISIEVYKLLEYEIVLSSYTTYEYMNSEYYKFTLSSRWHSASFSVMTGFEQNMLMQQKLITYYPNEKIFYGIGPTGRPSAYLIDYYSNIKRTALGGFNDIRNNLPYHKSYLRKSFTDDGTIPGLTGQYYILTNKTNGIDGYYFIKQRNNSLTQ